MPLPTVDLILALADAVMGVGLSSLEAPLLDKRKEKKLTAGPSKRSKKKAGETSLAFLPSSGANPKLWKPEFFASKLGKQVTVADSTKDHDTSLAPARAVTLPNDVAPLVEESSETIKDLLVMQQVQVSILTSVACKLPSLNLYSTF